MQRAGVQQSTVRNADRVAVACSYTDIVTTRRRSVKHTRENNSDKNNTSTK